MIHGKCHVLLRFAFHTSSKNIKNTGAYQHTRMLNEPQYTHDMSDWM